MYSVLRKGFKLRAFKEIVLTFNYLFQKKNKMLDIHIFRIEFGFANHLIHIKS